MYLYDVSTRQQITNAAELTFFLKGASMWQNIDGVNTQLEISQTCRVGNYCFKNSAANSGVSIYGTSTSNRGFLQMEVATCSMMDLTPHPTTGQYCYQYDSTVVMVLEVTNFIEQTGKI